MTILLIRYFTYLFTDVLGYLLYCLIHLLLFLYTCSVIQLFTRNLIKSLVIIYYVATKENNIYMNNILIMID
jgi:hypothetical protein